MAVVCELILTLLLLLIIVIILPLLLGVFIATFLVGVGAGLTYYLIILSIAGIIWLTLFVYLNIP